ncbi:MAG: hypothetical protein AAB662_02545 [Patescibacteria group bacterium]
MKQVIKNCKDLPREKEIELSLWLGFLEDLIDNAFVQIRRWKRFKNGWDLNMLIVIIANIDEARENLKQFLCFDKEIWEVFRIFERKFRKNKLKYLRNDIIHPKLLFKLQNKNGQPFLRSPILNIGGYNVSKDEYTFGSNIIILSETFEIIETLSKNIRSILETRLRSFYENGIYEGIIPWTKLHGFNKKKIMKDRIALNFRQ